MRCSDPTRCGCSRCSADTALLAELAGEWREPDEVALFAEIEKFCGGPGSKRPGPCPKGRSKAHLTMRIHATAAAKQAQTAADKLAKEHARHAKHRPGTKSHAAASTRLAAAAGEHLKATLKADRLQRKARALEHQHQVAQKVKEAARAKREAGKKKPEKPPEKPPDNPPEKPAAKAPEPAAKPAPAAVVPPEHSGTGPDTELRGRYQNIKAKYDQATKRLSKMPQGGNRDRQARLAGALNFTLIGVRDEMEARGLSGESPTQTKPSEKPAAAAPEPAAKPAPAAAAPSKTNDLLQTIGKLKGLSQEDIATIKSKVDAATKGGKITVGQIQDIIKEHQASKPTAAPEPGKTAVGPRVSDNVLSAIARAANDTSATLHASRADPERIRQVATALLGHPLSPDEYNQAAAQLRSEEGVHVPDHPKGSSAAAAPAPGKAAAVSRAPHEWWNGLSQGERKSALEGVVPGGALGAAHEKALGRSLNMMQSEVADQVKEAHAKALDAYQHSPTAQGKAAQPAVPAEHVSHVLAAVKAHDRGANLAPLHKVREHLHQAGLTSREHQDAAIHAARRKNLVTASNLEGRHGTTPEEREAAIHEGDDRLGYLSVRKHAERFSEPDGIDALLYELFAEHDVSGEARDADGEWTTGGAAATTSDGHKDQERVEKTDRRRTEDDIARMNKTFGAGTAMLERPDNRVFSDQHRLQVEAEVKQALTAAMPREVRPSTMYVPKLNRTDLITDERGTALISTPGNVVHSGVPDPAGIVSVKSTHTNRETHIYPGESAAARQAKIRWTFGMKQTSEEKAAVRASRYAPMPENHAEQFSEPDGLDALLGELLRFSEYDGKLPAVDVFAVGNHRGQDYTRQHLDEMVDNFNRFSAGQKPVLPVPAVLGHKEDQDVLKRSDLPAAAWGERLYRVGDKLRIDWANMPRKVAQLIKHRRYRRTSAEIYPNPQAAGLEGSGMMLRRVGFLGGDIPELKTLDDIPLPEEHSEQFAQYETILQRFCELNPGNPECLLCCFSEVESMNENQAPGSREDMLAKLQEHGVDGGALEGCPDGALAEMLRVLDDRSESPEEEPEEEERPEEMNDTPEEMEEEPRRVEEPVEEEPGEEEEYEDPAKKRRFNAGCGDKKPMPFSEKAHKALSRIIAVEVGKAVKRAVKAETSGSLKRVQKFHEDYEASERTKTVDAFIQSRLLQHKILPYELDAADPANLRDRFLRANGKTVVAKFSEGGKEIELTDLELQMREIDRRPAFQFGEQFKDPADGKDAGSEKAKVERHFETYRESMTRVGLTKENLVKAFETRQKQEPDLTADRFLNVTTRTS